MPSTFESFGVKFLYPDNWKPLERSEDEGEQGVTLELPGGGFFSLERDREGFLDEELIEEVADTIDEQYELVERERVQLEGAGPDEQAVEFRFYYLDLLIVSRLVLMTAAGSRLVVQIQAESRDFEANAAVFDALLQQLRQA